MRARTQPPRADPTPTLEFLLSPRHNRQPCTCLLGESLSQGDGTIPEPHIIYFTIHRLLGDLAWMIAGTEPEFFPADKDDEEAVDMLSDDNLALLYRNLYWERLQSDGCLEC